MTRYMYGAADEKFVKAAVAEPPAPKEPFKFKLHQSLRPRDKFDRDEVSIVYKTTPDLLLNLCINVIDKIPLPSVYEWTNVDICRWLKKIGYSHFQNTFRVNLINGRTLLLLDASALSAMNIKNWDDIKRLSYFIRCLFFFELALFCRSVSLPSEHYYDLYKLFRVRTGPKIHDTRRTDLWIRLQILHEKLPHLTHWGMLERWLGQVKGPTWLFGGDRRAKLYKCKSKQSEPEPEPLPCKKCECMPPCECFWNERDLKKAWRLKCLPKSVETRKTVKNPFSEFTNPDNIYHSLSKPTLKVLQNTYPEKYKPKSHSLIQYSTDRLSTFRFAEKAPKRRSTKRGIHFG